MKDVGIAGPEATRSRSMLFYNVCYAIVGAVTIEGLDIAAWSLEL
jgi:hypothetical protein